MYLFSINKKGTKILHPDAYKLCPELKNLEEDELLAIILAYDYYSPYRQLPLDERLRRAKAQVYKGKDTDLWERKKIKDAVDMYLSLQYDPRHESIRVYQDKIASIHEKIRETEDHGLLINLGKLNKEFRKQLLEIEQELLMEDEKDAVQLQGKGSLSLLERLLRNQERYNEIRERRSNDNSKEEEMPMPE